MRNVEPPPTTAVDCSTFGAEATLRPFVRAGAGTGSVPSTPSPSRNTTEPVFLLVPEG